MNVRIATSRSSVPPTAVGPIESSIPPTITGTSTRPAKTSILTPISSSCQTVLMRTRRLSGLGSSIAATAGARLECQGPLLWRRGSHPRMHRVCQYRRGGRPRPRWNPRAVQRSPPLRQTKGAQPVGHERQLRSQHHRNLRLVSVHSAFPSD